MFCFEQKDDMFCYEIICALDQKLTTNFELIILYEWYIFSLLKINTIENWLMNYAEDLINNLAII